MATVIAVHGTFAHAGGSADALNIGETAEPQWWQPGSSFEGQLRELVRGESGELNFVPFSWSSENSELARRRAASRLLGQLRELDAKGEEYCLVGHSHGGSVIAGALVESVARGKPLEGLQRWFTVGTPFVELKRERFLFTRLSLTRQVLFVASLMLLGMFVFYMFGEVFDSTRRITTERLFWIFLISGAMMSIPFFVLYIFFRIDDRRKLFAYGNRVLARAEEAYGNKWFSLCHEDDEAVHGLKYLPKVNLQLFEKDFAVSTFTMAAIFVLPLAYLFAVTSPPLMVGIAEFLKTRVYGVEEYKAAETPVEAAQKEIRRLAREMRSARDEAERSGLDPSRALDARQRANQLRDRIRTLRNNLEATFPEIDGITRAIRFKRRFLERDGKPCEGGTLCGGGHDFTLNSKLLYHVVTDELSNAIISDDFAPGFVGGVLRLALPIILVPLFFGVLALAIMAVIRFFANHLSEYLSRWLNRITLAELRRNAYGNDTDGEIAFASDHRPAWITSANCHLPSEIGDRMAEASNAATIQSLSKFRNAISTLAFSEGEGHRSSLISQYLSWRELIHTTYFEVPEFRKLLARAISDAKGFAPTDRFLADPDYKHAEQWLAKLTPRPATDAITSRPAAGSPTAASFQI